MLLCQEGGLLNIFLCKKPKAPHSWIAIPGLMKKDYHGKY